MEFLKNNWMPLLGFFFLLACSAIAWQNVHHTEPVRFIGYSHGHIMVDRTVLDAYFSEHGGKALITLTAGYAGTITRANFHSLGHSVGEILYKREGLGAVVTCGDSFEYGCLHQVIGKAFDEYGSGTLAALEKRCSEYSDEAAQRQCQHGLGHGMMYRSGYDDTKLEPLMQTCDTITTKRPIPFTESCHAGLMMEYNEHFMTMEYQDEGINGRPASTSTPFAICDGLSTAEHKNMCIWWALPWIHGNLFDFTYTPQVFAELGKICLHLDDPKLADICYRAIGRQAGVNANIDPARVIELCTAVSDESQPQRLCITQAAKLYASSGNPSASKAICDLVSGDSARSCQNVN